MFIICRKETYFRRSRKATWREQRYTLRILFDRRIKLWIIDEWVLALTL